VRASAGGAASRAVRLREHFARAGGYDLTADQRRALEAVLRGEPLCHVRYSLLDIYGVPQDRDALKVRLRRT
jgi:hypothetical protein